MKKHNHQEECKFLKNEDPVIVLTHKKIKWFFGILGISLGGIIGLTFWANYYVAKKIAQEEIYQYDKSTQGKIKEQDIGTNKSDERN